MSLNDILNLGWFYSENKNEYQLAKISQLDRSTHCYVIGASGSGKSKFLESLLIQDVGVELGTATETTYFNIYPHKGFCVIDPHGDLVDAVKGWLSAKVNILFHTSDQPNTAEDFFNKVVVIDPTDKDNTVIFNPLETQAGITPAEQAMELVGAFKKIWIDSWGARLEEILRNSLIVLIENKLTLLELPVLLTDGKQRNIWLENCRHPIAKQYFQSRFNNLNPKTRTEWIESTLNKVNSFLSDDRIRQMFCLPESTINFREIIDNKKILLIKLAKGRLKDNANLLGALLTTKLQMAFLSRTDIPQSQRMPFNLYIDEFQNFATDTFVEILSEARKYGLSLTLAHQNLQQLSDELQASILGNTGIQIYFRTNRADAEVLAKECFNSTGLEVKYNQISREKSDPTFYGYQEEWEHYFQALTQLEPRTCIVKHKRDGGTIFIPS